MQQMSDDEYDDASNHSDEVGDESGDELEDDDEVNIASLHAGKVTKTIVVPVDECTTSDRLTLPELSEIYNIRISQIEAGSRVFVDFTGLTSAREIADREIMARAEPIIMLRLVREEVQPNGEIHVWVHEQKTRLMLLPHQVKPNDRVE